MKHCIILVMIVCLWACNKPPQTPKNDAVPIEMCVDMYAHILDLVVTESVDQGHNLSQSERRIAMDILDEDFTKRGTRDRFMLYCTTKMTEEHVGCMLVAGSTNKMNACRNMYSTRN